MMNGSGRRTWATIAAAAVVLAATLSAGCGTHAHRRIGMRLDHATLVKAGIPDGGMPPDLGRLAVAPTLLGKNAGLGAVDVRLPGKKAYDIPRESFDRVLAESLEATGGFRSVSVEGGGAPGGADLVLELDLEWYRLTFQERNGNNIPGILLWLFTSPVSHWVHDEDYQLEFTGWARIYDAASGDMLAEIDLGECDARDSLNMHERQASVTPYLLTFFVPPTAVGSDEDALLQALLPAALGDVWPTLLAEFASLSGDRPPSGLRIDFDPEAPVTFEFTEPQDGDRYDGGALDLQLDLVFPGDSRDLARVAINDEVVIEYRNRRSRPIQKRISVEESGVEPVDGRVVISVTLDSEVEPIEAFITMPDGGSGE